MTHLRTAVSTRSRLQEGPETAASASVVDVSRGRVSVWPKTVSWMAQWRGTAEARPEGIRGSWDDWVARSERRTMMSLEDASVRRAIPPGDGRPAHFLGPQRGLSRVRRSLHARFSPRCQTNRGLLLRRLYISLQPWPSLVPHPSPSPPLPSALLTRSSLSTSHVRSRAIGRTGRWRGTRPSP